MKRISIIIAIILGALAIICVGAYLILFAPANYKGEAGIFIVDKGQTVSEIIDNLKIEGFVRSSAGTKIAFKLSQAANIQIGPYNISPRMDAWQIARIVGGSEIATVRITFPEGYTINQMANLLDEKEIITAQDFITAAENFPPDFEFLRSRPNNSLEGYLFPDTYNMNKGTPAEGLLVQMLNNFDNRTRDLNFASSAYSLHQVITLASLVEKEANNSEDRKLVAGVLLNRLSRGMRLDVDATVRYLTNNWSEPITQSDLNINSPYNTRKVAGLPPGPICNPGLAAIEAVLSPTRSNYLYYLTGSDGVTYYATTLEQHNLNKSTRL